MSEWEELGSKRMKSDGNRQHPIITAQSVLASLDFSSAVLLAMAVWRICSRWVELLAEAVGAGLQLQNTHVCCQGQRRSQDPGRRHLLVHCLSPKKDALRRFLQGLRRQIREENS